MLMPEYTGRMLDCIAGVDSVEFAADNTSILYTTRDRFGRPYKVGLVSKLGQS
jgi:hypothetical protein